MRSIAECWASFHSAQPLRNVYDRCGILKTITYPNGVQSFTEYDGNTGLVNVAGHRGANGALLYSETFAYYPGSRLYQSITRRTPSGAETAQYTYDAYERLETVTEADGRRTAYEYDAFGNRTQETVTNLNDPGASGGGPKAYGAYVYEYAAGGNRLNRILFNGQVQETFTYNNAGRITQRAHATAGATTYAYDDRGLLISVTRPGTTISYTYDALGVRKSKTANGATTRYLTAPLFGLPRVVAELDASQNIQATYVYGGPRQIKEEPAPADRSRDLYLLHDGLVGSVTHALDMTGNLRNQYEYDAFGLRTPLAAAANGSSKHYGYTGEETDEETGLIYLRARYYDPNLGRFISADPFWGRLEEPASQNRYVYVQNNPLIYTDPSGYAVILSQHPAFNAPYSPAYHTSLTFIPDKPQDFSLDSRFQGNPLSATVGGQPGGGDSSLPFGWGNLQTSWNNPGDSLFNATHKIIIPTPPGITDTQHISQYLSAADSYRDDLGYAPIPAQTGDAYNSGGYTSGLITVVGDVVPNLPGWQPGYGKPIPLDNDYQTCH